MEIKSFYIQDSGDPGVGLPATSYELSGGFSFDCEKSISDFKEDLKNLFYSYCITEGRVTIITDVEHQSRLEAETENTDFDFAVPLYFKSGGKFKLTSIQK